ncbi:MAG: hypothetical protein GON13_02665 [Nanoarchaeota archaeon]|nr:hypothetical protein [Nanoarchaeota archaeon]
MVYIFGIDVPLLELLTILSIVVVVYLIILEFEFRQLKKSVKTLVDLTKRLRGIEDELEDDLKLLKGKKKRRKRK